MASLFTLLFYSCGHARSKSEWSPGGGDRKEGATGVALRSFHKRGIGSGCTQVLFPRFCAPPPTGRIKSCTAIKACVKISFSGNLSKKYISNVPMITRQIENHHVMYIGYIWFYCKYEPFLRRTHFSDCLKQTVLRQRSKKHERCAAPAPVSQRKSQGQRSAEQLNTHSSVTLRS